AFVIPPLLSQLETWGMAEHDALAYQYRYDGRGRLVEKKLPGKGWEYMVYDKADRLILSQDANQRASSSWIISKYDLLGRPIYTGILKADNTRIGMQNQISGGAIIEGRDNTPLTANGMPYYYTNMHWGLDTLLSVTYYDSYPQQYSFNPPFPSSILGQPVLTENPTADGRSTKGLPVLSLVKNIEDDSWTKTYTYYDQKGRVIGTHSINHLGGYTHTESKLDFAGLPLQTITTHLRKTGEPGITVKERFVYDNGNRLKEHYHQVDSKPEELLVKNSYNELSQLVNKEVGNNLQSIDYAYNIRGWMTDINKNQMSLTDLGGKLFSYKIKYNQREGIENPDPAQFSGKNVQPRYNGNIAEVDWRAVESLGANPSLTPKRYGYAYDGLDRLLAGYYQNPMNPNSKEHTESLQYDLNGNIMGLYRTAAVENSNTTATVIDNLEYTYGSTNQVSVIKDHQNNPSGYEGGGGTIQYDLNGNMWQIPDKNITKITYNHMNLPDKIEYGNLGLSGLHNYLYRADGTKVQKKLPKFECGIINCYTITDIIDYLDGFQYYHSESSNNDGGGSIEELRMISEKLKYAYEQQAYSAESGIATAQNQGLNTSLGITAVKTPNLMFFPTAEGFYDYTKDQYIYQYKDHLGNTRISFGRNSAGALEITDANDYYPFGMNHLKTGNSFFGQGTYKNYKYNGKELQETGMYDYGARMYMPDLGRWGVVDPLAEKMTRYSPYNYAFNNPLSFIDPDGREGLGWIHQVFEGDQHRLTYNANINTAQEAIDAGYANVYGVAETGEVTDQTTGNVKYTLNADGTYTDAGGNTSYGATTTPGGMYIKGQGAFDLTRYLSHLGNEGGNFYTNLGGAAPLNYENPFFRGDIDKIVSLDGFMGGMVNSLSRGNDGSDKISFMVDLMSLVDLAYTFLGGKEKLVNRDTIISAKVSFDNGKDSTMQFKVPKVGNIYQNWHTGNNYDEISNPYVRAKVDSAAKSRK
ncbi:RHS repeat-associated core domain-containing protein, partial [Chryseobacterium sp.]|uniref:RHS repeat-associated core domain-containing protein n=2 Tax=unclassified Chryseobacterium TaxID=2593645 RepID=UPI00261B1C2C